MAGSSSALEEKERMQGENREQLQELRHLQTMAEAAANKCSWGEEAQGMIAR